MKKIVIVLAIVVVGVIVLSLFLKRPGKNNLPFQERAGQDSQTRNLVALGSSFTKANNLSSSLKGDNPDYSFATGTKFESFYLYLKNKGENLKPINLAESGADSQKALSQQIPNALSFKPKYVTLDIMADIFEEERPNNFGQNLREIAKQLKSLGATVLVGNYPNLILMRKAAYPACAQDKLNLGIDRVTEEKLRLFNQTIAEVASEYGFILVDNFTTLGSQDVSDYDCLHPNIGGQEKLADVWIEAFEKGGEQK